MPHRLDNVPGACFALGADHGRTLANAAQSFTEIASAADERHLVRPLTDMMLLVRRCQHFALVDVVHAQRFQHLRFGKVANARLRHHRYGHGAHDLLDDLHRRHTGHAAFLADIRRHTLERHHGGRARVLGDFGLVRRGDVHDHATLQHLRQAYLQFHLLVIFPHAILLG